LKTLDALARMGFFRTGSPGRSEPSTKAAGDVAGSAVWRQYLASRQLFDLWSPRQGPWVGYAKPTLFAAVDEANDLLPRRVELAGQPRLPLAHPEGAIILDLPGALTVAYAGHLARVGWQPVPLFNNWPHPQALVDMQPVLEALLYYSPWAQESRTVEPRGPVFMLDRRRFGKRQPQPNDFDNRYFHPESDLPGVGLIKKWCQGKVRYIAPAAPDGSPPHGPVESDDMNPLLLHYAKYLDVEVALARSDQWSISAPQRIMFRPRKTPLNTVKDPMFSGYRRNAAGGFGKLVPEPSSGGG
jgi:hypothetical protein